MHRLLIAAALAAALPVAASAQNYGLVDATPGALAGRSPHQAFRPAKLASGCPAQMHSLPAGKLPVYGAPMLARPGCEPSVTVARAAGASVQTGR